MQHTPTVEEHPVLGPIAVDIFGVQDACDALLEVLDALAQGDEDLDVEAEVVQALQHLDGIVALSISLMEIHRPVIEGLVES